MIITVAGDPGSGKSTVGKLVAKHLGIPYFSLGDRRAEYAKELGLNLDELNAKSDLDPAIDQIFDDWQETLGEQKGDFVLDSLLGWHFYPSSLKVFLTLDTKVAAKRIFDDRKINANRADEPEYEDVGSVEQIIEARKAGNWKRLRGILTKLELEKTVETGSLATESLAAKLNTDFAKELLINDGGANKNWFDLYIDTAHLTIDQVVAQIISPAKN